MKIKVSAYIKKRFALFVFGIIATPAWAASQIVTLSIPGMTCGACPITVRTSLNRVPGVEKVNIDDRQKRVVVTFDNAKTSVQQLTKATGDAGYPSNIVH